MSGIFGSNDRGSIPDRIPYSKLISPVDYFSFNNQRLADLGDPVEPKDAANKAYIDLSLFNLRDENIALDAGITFSKLASPVSAFNFNSQRLTSLGNPELAGDAVNKKYVDYFFYAGKNTSSGGTTYPAWIGDGHILSNAGIAFSKLASPINDFSFNSQRLTSLGDPTESEDATNKNYVDSEIQRNAFSITRSTVRTTTATLAPKATEYVDLALGKSFLLLSIGTTSPAWIRVYATPAYRTDDAQRTPDKDAPANSGIIAEIISDKNLLNIDLEPIAVGANLELTPTSNIAIAISNLGAEAAAITVNFKKITLET